MTLLEAFDRGLLTDHEFSVLREIDLYAGCAARGELELVAGASKVRRLGCCNVCSARTQVGVRCLVRPSHANGYCGGWRRFCGNCLERIHARVVAQPAPALAYGVDRESIRLHSG